VAGATGDVAMTSPNPHGLLRHHDDRAYYAGEHANTRAPMWTPHLDNAVPLTGYEARRLCERWPWAVAELAHEKTATGAGPQR